MSNSESFSCMATNSSQISAASWSFPWGAIHILRKHISEGFLPPFRFPLLHHIINWKYAKIAIFEPPLPYVIIPNLKSEIIGKNWHFWTPLSFPPPLKKGCLRNIRMVPWAKKSWSFKNKGSDLCLEKAKLCFIQCSAVVQSVWYKALRNSIWICVDRQMEPHKLKFEILTTRGAFNNYMNKIRWVCRSVKIPRWVTWTKCRGPFIYYVITFLGFLDPLPPYVIMFLVLKIIKNWHFLTPLPHKWLRNSIWMVPYVLWPLALCMVSIQERFLIKSAYGIWGR